MMGTYFHLIEEGAATKEDRALTLARYPALRRATVRITLTRRTSPN